MTESHSDARNPVLEAALAYAARGWRVFPCDPHPEKPRSKQPLVVADRDEDRKSIHGTGWPKKATTDAMQIRSWWRKWPDALIGMAPGWGDAFVIDLDPKGEPVEAVEARLVEALGHPLPAGPRTRTQSGGLHLWFRRPAGASWGNDTPGLANIDIRCDAGYVILPPSQLRNGNAYSWLGQDLALPDLPVGVLNLIEGRKRHAPHEPTASTTRAPVRAPLSESHGLIAIRRYVTTAVDRIAADLASTGIGRGTALYSAACQLGRFVAADGMSERAAIATLVDASELNGLLAKDGSRSVDRDIQRGFQEGFASAEDVRKRLQEVARDAEDRAARRSPPQPPPAIPDERQQGYADARSDWAVSNEPTGGIGYSQPPIDEGDPGFDEDGCDAPPPPPALFDSEAIKTCSGFDHSDTDNGARVRHHFGHLLRVMQRKGVRNQEFLVWNDTHWDLDTGQDKSFAMAQDIGGLIGLEADYLAHTPQELRALQSAASALDELADLEIAIERQEADIRKLGKGKDIDVAKIEAAELKLKKARGRRHVLERTIDDGKSARDALERRQVARRRFGISSKNEGRLKAMLSCAAPHMTVKPDQFNADPMRVATLSHTLVFRREIDPENPDPDGIRYTATLDARKFHDPADLITFVVPLEYDATATAMKWLAFLDRFLPVPSVRRFFQVYAGLGLLGETVQKLVFNYGDGANGKSIAMQTIFNVLGGLSVNLEPESITGTDAKAGGAASPDLIKLFGKRFLRISEIPKNVPVKEDLIKKLTGGGEEISVRGLFQGMIDFVPIFTAMLSGNNYPKIDGTDHGIWRRIAVVHWPVKIPEDEQRPFNEVIDGFRPEYSGILNWLIEGARIYLTEGLVVPPEVRAATEEYRNEMDPTSGFVTACVERVEGETVKARALYEAYVTWSMANSVKPIHETRFGIIMKGKFHRDDGRTRSYHDCKLHDVPQRPHDNSHHQPDIDDPAAPYGEAPNWEPDPGR